MLANRPGSRAPGHRACNGRRLPVREFASLIGTSAVSGNGPIGLLPRSEATLDVARRAYAGVLCRLHGHRRSLPEGAVEHEPLAGRSGKLVEHPTWAHILLEIRVRGMERSGDRAVLLALAWFTQVDQHHIRLPEQSH